MTSAEENWALPISNDLERSPLSSAVPRRFSLGDIAKICGTATNWFGRPSSFDCGACARFKWISILHPLHNPPLSHGGRKKEKRENAGKGAKEAWIHVPEGTDPGFRGAGGGWRLLKLKRDVLNLFERRGKCLLICFHVRTCQWAPILYMASEY